MYYVYLDLKDIYDNYIGRLTCDKYNVYIYTKAICQQHNLLSKPMFVFNNKFQPW
jgi:hypothetical protein